MTMAHPGPTYKETYVSGVRCPQSDFLFTHSSARPVSLWSQMEHAGVDRVSNQDPFHQAQNR